MILIIGNGDVGGALCWLMKKKNIDHCVIDKGDPIPDGEFDFAHICIPYSDDFVSIVEDYQRKIKADVWIINSTVAPGTSMMLGAVHSPVRGQHDNLCIDLQRYTKWIGADDEETGKKVAAHYSSLGLRVVVQPNSVTTEIVKLLDTTQYGVLIAWAQEAERYCNLFGVSHSKSLEFGQETQDLYRLRPKVTPGFIGGHCVMPNIKILQKIEESGLLSEVERSNEEYKCG